LPPGALVFRPGKAEDSGEKLQNSDAITFSDVGYRPRPGAGPVDHLPQSNSGYGNKGQGHFIFLLPWVAMMRYALLGYSMKRIKQRDIDDLYVAILRLERLDECRRFFRDLLTETEIREFAERWKVARLLSQGIPYTAIQEETGLSSRTIARVHKWMKRGKGGYTMMLKRIAASEYS
jgi:TrpR-related protein YerC/YecD